MSGGSGVRRLHRWVSIVFTAGVVVNFVALGGGTEPPFWVYFLALIPLAVLQLTGLYLLVQPYADRWRSGRRH